MPSFLETAAEEKLVLTYWFDPVPNSAPYTVTVQLTGSRIGVEGRRQAGDQFVHEETVEVAQPDGGPVSITARIGGINPGEWEVTARTAGPSRAERRRKGGPRTATPQVSLRLARWSLGGRLREAAGGPVKTTLAPFAMVPGLLPGVWAGTGTLGVLLGLALQGFVAHQVRLPVFQSSAVAVLAILVGMAGAKAWFVVLHRRERLWNGWCIQGLMTGVVIVLLGGAFIVHLPIGTLLDTAAPGLLIGMAVGRVGCFFAGCCVGRPTRAWWGVWASDQRIGVRRIPTQFMESALALVAGLASLFVVLTFGTANGAIFVATAAAYTLVRQAILQLRAERRKSLLGPPLTAAAAAVVLVADLALLGFTGGRGL
ncbi:MAG: prolipoprotein diacylglyceryl transferase [Candidatus Dormibacteraeota bacterium]|nr:prolipoprotein diacylglyceryl transferase [Candidatus Dormibacteraeota bacterium]